MKQQAKIVPMEGANINDRGSFITPNIVRMSSHPIRTALQAFKQIKKLWRLEGNSSPEQFMALYLDEECYLVRYMEITPENGEPCPVDPTSLVECLIRIRSFRLIVAKRYANNIVQLSENDSIMARTMQSALQPFEMILQDFLILSKTDFYSFAKDGKI